MTKTIFADQLLDFINNPPVVELLLIAIVSLTIIVITDHLKDKYHEYHKKSPNSTNLSHNTPHPEGVI